VTGVRGAEPRDSATAITERLLRDAGLAECRRILDVGCGRGDVTWLAARVAEGARVLGVDSDASAVAAATSRRGPGVENPSFVVQDLGTITSELGSFDAIVGRRVLMYVRDRGAAIRTLASVLEPGGILVFQEADATMTPASIRRFPLHEQVHRWMWDTVVAEGATRSVGFELPGLFESAGLVVEGVRAEAIVETAGHRLPTANVIRVMLPRILAQGIATEQEIDIDTLDSRLADEFAQLAGSAYVGGMAFSAWARKPR